MKRLPLWRSRVCSRSVWSSLTRRRRPTATSCESPKPHLFSVSNREVKGQSLSSSAGSRVSFLPLCRQSVDVRRLLQAHQEQTGEGGASKTPGDPRPAVRGGGAGGADSLRACFLSVGAVGVHQDGRGQSPGEDIRRRLPEVSERGKWERKTEAAA